jgi:hypothetical protein
VARRALPRLPHDLLELDGEDLRTRPLLARKAALAKLLRRSKTGIVFNEHLAADGPLVFEHACKLGAEGIFKSTGWLPVRVISWRFNGECAASLRRAFKRFFCLTRFQFIGAELGAISRNLFQRLLIKS